MRSPPAPERPTAPFPGLPHPCGGPSWIPHPSQPPQPSPSAPPLSSSSLDRPFGKVLTASMSLRGPLNIVALIASVCGPGGPLEDQLALRGNSGADDCRLKVAGTRETGQHPALMTDRLLASLSASSAAGLPHLSGLRVLQTTSSPAVRILFFRTPTPGLSQITCFSPLTRGPRFFLSSVHSVLPWWLR